MPDSAYILIVDDDQIALESGRNALSACHSVDTASSGAEALQKIACRTPDIVLLDVSMPEMDGYGVCRKLRENESLEGLPIIFVSALIDESERMKGFEAGGDDYLAKPIMPIELCRKVESILQWKQERAELKGNLGDAFRTAMTAMTAASEIGTVLHFLRNSFQAENYFSLGKGLIATLDAYGLKGSVQLRGRNGSLSMDQEGPCSPLQEAVLSNMASQGRIFEFSSHLSCSYERVTIIVTNIPREDPEKHGRMRDNLALLAEGVNARMEALDNSLHLSQLLQRTGEALRKLGDLHSRQSLDFVGIADEFNSRLNRLLLSLGLSGSQEEELLDLAEHFLRGVETLYLEGHSVEREIRSMLNHSPAESRP